MELNRSHERDSPRLQRVHSFGSDAAWLALAVPLKQFQFRRAGCKFARPLRHSTGQRHIGHRTCAHSRDGFLSRRDRKRPPPGRRLFCPRWRGQPVWKSFVIETAVDQHFFLCRPALSRHAATSHPLIPSQPDSTRCLSRVTRGRIPAGRLRGASMPVSSTIEVHRAVRQFPEVSPSSSTIRRRLRDPFHGHAAILLLMYSQPRSARQC